MPKTKITVATFGHMPSDFNRQKIKNWKSSVFEIAEEIKSYALRGDADTEGWAYSDHALENSFLQPFEGDFLVAIVNVPLEDNWYSRRLTANRIVFSFHEIKQILMLSNIPLENVLYRMLYSYTLIYQRNRNRIPTMNEFVTFTHDETKGCLFDMNGIKTDVVDSCHKPIICPDCVGKLREQGIATETIEKCQKEIHQIRKATFYQINDWIKKHPLLSLAISGVVAIILGVIGSVLGSYAFNALNGKADINQIEIPHSPPSR